MNPTPKKPVMEGNDILFVCPQCGKNLVIDSRGAGLNVPCPDCGNDLEVPIPEGFDLADLDQKIISSGLLNGNKAEMPAPHSADADSSDAARQLSALKAELETLRAQQQYLVQQHADMLKTVKAVNRQFGELHRACDNIRMMLEGLVGPQADETQKID